MNEGGGNEGENGRGMSELRRLQLRVAAKIRREYYRAPAHARANTVWTTLFGYLLDEIREREAEMDRKYENVWRDTEDYLSKLDTFIRDLRHFSHSADPCDEDTQMRKIDIQTDLAMMQKKISDRDDVLDTMSQNLRGLRRSREELLRLRETPEFALLENWVGATCNKCIAMENEITNIKVRICQKNEDLLQLMGHGSNIFSKVNIEELKKLPPFKLDLTIEPEPEPEPEPQPSTSSSESLHQKKENKKSS